MPLCLGMTIILYPMFRPEQLGDAAALSSEQSAETSYWQLLSRTPWADQADLFPAGPTLQAAMP